jgi:dihydrofolate reductase
MARLIYSMLTSLDGYIADEHGNFDWAMPDDEVHGFINDLQRSIGTQLYGRRMYEVMVAWETMALDAEPSVMRDFAEIWRSTEKIVYSTTLTEVTSARTRLERAFDPEVVRRLKESAEQDITVSGPGLAGAALQAGLVDECQLFVMPVVVGSGNHAFARGTFTRLELMEERRFDGGTVFLRYRTLV